MLNKVSINVSDGIDYAIVTFTIDVQKEAGAGISALIIVVPIVLVLLVAGIVAFLLIRRRSSMKTEEANETEHISVKDEDKVPHAGVTDVPLTPTEAHAHLGKGSKAVSYEDLYGTPAPKGEEEALTTRELRDYIHGEVEGLEKLRLKETPEFEELEE